MKKIIAATVATGLLALSAGAVFAAVATYDSSNSNYQAGTGIKHTRHDLSSTGAGTIKGTDVDGLDRICIYCHAPHHAVTPESAEADRNVKYVPLWNHEITWQEYELYSNGSEDPGDQAHRSYAEFMRGTNDVGSVSRLCLSCHDGTVAANQYGYAPSDTVSDPATHDTVEGTKWEIGGLDADGFANLKNHHPVGFNYNNAVTDESNKSRGELAASADGTIGSYTIAELLWGNNMECATCHDVHNSQNTGEKFLWTSDAGSALCLSCHLK